MRGVTVTKQVHFTHQTRGRRELHVGPEPEPTIVNPGRVPRVARLMALAIKLDDLVRSGAVADQAELARLGYVSRARVTQIMHMLRLAPDIQEAILTLPPTMAGDDAINERHLRPIMTLIDWEEQRQAWRQLLSRRHAVTVCV